MRIGKMILTWVLALLMAVNSASACRWRGWSYCGPSPCYYPTYYSCYSYSCAPSYCPICAGGAPVTTNRAPAPPTPQPQLETVPPAAEPPAAEPIPAEVPRTVPPTEAAPAPAEAAPLTPPAEKPMPEQPAPKPEVEDLFKEPAPGAAPAEKPSETPAAPTKPSDVEDLFKEPAAGTAPGAAPAETPKPAEPAAKPGDVEDLFKEPAKGAAPAEKPVETPAKPSGDVEDLFKDVEKKSTAVETPTDAEIEALFSRPADGLPASAPETKTLEAEAEQLFGTRAGTDDKLDVTAARVWTDNTGKFQVRARLVDVGPSHVRLLKETGKYTTVPFSRLSSDDRAFVRQHSERAVAASF
jgi:hypothetical protein